MATNEFNEILETLKEIETSINLLTPDLSDKKVISDVMLALEKVLSYVKQSQPPKVARLANSLALLYEKFLMEGVDDGTEGINATRSGVDLIRTSMEEKGSLTSIDSKADEVAESIANNYSIMLEAAKGASGASEDDDDNFFGDAEPPAEKEIADDQDASESVDNEDTREISRIGSEITTLDEDFSDKKSVSDIMIALESLVTRFHGANKPGAIVEVTRHVAAIFEKSIMEGISEGATALSLSGEAIGILSSYFSGYSDEQTCIDDATELMGKISEKCEINLSPMEPAVAPTVSPKESEQVKTPPVVEVDGLAGHDREHLASEESSSISVATEDDMMLYTEFVSETADTVSAIEEGLLELEENPKDEELINTIFRAFHSLKGAAGFLGLSAINITCHESETLLDKLRKKTLVCTQPMIDAFLQAVDVVKSVNERLHETTLKAKGELPDAELELPSSNIEALVAALVSLATGVAEEVIDATPANRIGDILLEKQEIDKSQLENALAAQKPVGDILVEMGAVDKKALSSALKEQETRRKKVQITSLKVDTEKLDSLLELVGELVISQSIVIQDDALNEEGNRSLHKNLSNLGKITKNIQDHVMNLRMIPLRQTFQKMSRLVRDLSKKMNKPVNFHIVGEDTEIDKTLIEELNDPLVHLMRNAIDHGVDTPDERVAAGKPREGEVSLVAFHKGGNVYIEIKDDGKGIDRDRILAKAIEKGLVSSEYDISDNEIYNLIFAPGLSTAAKVTDVSGRGVGMDVVRSNIDRLGGKVEVASEKGVGTTLTIKLPLTMAIVDGMIVRIGEDRFIIPTISIRESIRPRKDEINTVRKKGEMINIRGKLLPLVRLHNLLQVSDAKYTNPWEGLVIIVESDDKEYGLMVDDLLGQQQVVIKSLGQRFKGLAGISGGTILGDGRVGLILDVSGIVTMN